MGRDGWVGRKTLRCTLEPGAVGELSATRKGTQRGKPRFVVVTEALLEKELVARFVEHH